MKRSIFTPLALGIARHISVVKKALVQGLMLSVLCGSASAVPLPFGTHYYDVVPAAGITWDAAKDAALASFYLGLEGHLVTITSPAEHAFVNTVIAAAGLGEIYAGGFQNPVTETNPQGGWTWVNGEGTFPGVDSVSPYATWNSGEPNDFYGSASEQYLGLNLGPGFNDEGNLELITGYVIEYDPNTIRPTVPDGGSTVALLGGVLALLGLAYHRLPSQFLRSAPNGD
jgi:hypothetical protein